MPPVYDVGQLEEVERELGIVGKPPMSPKEVRIAPDYQQGRYRVQPLPFDGAALTVPGAFTLTAVADRPCKPVKIILFNDTDAMGVGSVNIDGITVQGINQLLGTGLIPGSAFAEDAPSEDLPWDFAVLTSNGTMIMTGNLVGAITGTINIWAVAKVIAAQA